MMRHTLTAAQNRKRSQTSEAGGSLCGKHDWGRAARHLRGERAPRPALASASWLHAASPARADALHTVVRSRLPRRWREWADAKQSCSGIFLGSACGGHIFI